jgi:hypothetical protein
LHPFQYTSCFVLQASRAAFLNKVQQCFAVRAEVDSLLDVSRATFCRLTEGVHALADTYREQTGAAVKVGAGLVNCRHATTHVRFTLTGPWVLPAWCSKSMQ